MNAYQAALHKKALLVGAKYLQAEGNILNVLLQVEDEKIYRLLGKKSLFRYSTRFLGLTDSGAYTFIRVARKVREVPELLRAIDDRRISVGKAYRVAAALNAENCEELIQFAASHTDREIDFEVAKRNPKARRGLRIKPLSEVLVELQLTVTTEVFRKLERVAALNGSNIENAIEAMADLYIKQKDPVAKAERSRAKPRPKTVRKHSSSDTLSAETKHEVMLKTGGVCTFVDSEGHRCGTDRHIEIHHVRPRSLGGGNEIGNLTTLCSFHHHLLHERIEKMQNSSGKMNDFHPNP